MKGNKKCETTHKKRRVSFERRFNMERTKKIWNT